MMRVVGKVGFVAVALSLIATASAFASPRDTSIAAIPNEGGSVGPRTFMGTGFEASEGYGIGTVSNMNGWTCTNRNVVPPGCAEQTADFPPNPGDPQIGGFVNKGNGSAQGLLVTKNPNYGNTGTALVQLFERSPITKDFTMPTMNVDYRIDDNFGSSYLIVPQAPSEGKRITTIYFYYTGYRYLLEDADGHGPGTAFTFRQTGTWTGDTWQTLEMNVDHAARTFTISSGDNKQSLTDNWCRHVTGGADVCTFDLGANAAVGLGDQFEQVVIGSNNNQDLGLGSFSGGPAGMYIDNIQFKPEPGSLALLAAGALLALRRRTAR